MSKRRFGLPSLHALSAFETAARLGGFALAADELGVTPTAISHQIKALETNLEVALFERHRRGVVLTAAGHLLFEAVEGGFDEIARGLETLRARQEQEAITVRATTAVSSLWLTPRLARFWRRHGDVPVNQIVSDAVDRRDTSDLEIYYGAARREGMETRRLFGDRIMAMASPEFLATRRISSLDDLAAAPRIHLAVDGRRWTNWATWFAALGYDGRITARGGVTANNYTIALQAARDGVGVVLGWETLTEPLIRAGGLATVGPWRIAAPHDIRVALRRNASRRARLLRDWLLKSVS
jgi:DNA-binding transcriptional LysR family regulator